MGGTVDSQIQDALHQSSPDAAIRDVKHVMAKELQSLDPKSEIKATDYFNHTFVPDFVLSWKDASERASRDVYLRLNVEGPFIERDLASLHEDSPAFISIGREIHSDPDAEAVTTEYEDCLLSSALALENISSERSRTPLTQMLKTSLLQGGKGYLIGRSADGVQKAVRRTDYALTHLDTEAVAESVRTVNEHFTGGFSSRMERVMQVLWSSRGGDVERFPGSGRRGGALSAEELAEILPFLLRLEEIPNTEFWRSLGENINVRLLQDLESWSASPNLNVLVNANLDRIKVKSAALDHAQPDLFEDPDAGFSWKVEDSALCLCSSEVRLKFVDDRRKTAHRSHVGSVPRWSDIERRLDAYGIEGIEFTSPASKMRIQSSTVAGLRESTDMDALSTALGELARVISVQLRLPGARDDVEVDFDRSVVDVVGSPLGPHVLAHYGLDLLFQAPATTLEDLRSFVTADGSLPWWREKGMEQLANQDE
ncbi:hypothetical protein ABZ840_15340 [Streptomyces sp. NPDC047117]|uniref:hypothetical protein n=1 Tax=Streptomyces sp. NPDC047117 TaxID=3155379 RepID=UPI0033DCC907